METIRILEIVGAYVFYSFFISCYFLNITKDKFEQNIKNRVNRYNEELYKKYKNKEISSMVYKDSIRDFSSELRIAKIVNYIVSPILAIPITLTLLLRFANRE